MFDPGWVSGWEDGRLIDVEDWAEIRRLHKAEGLGVKTIARRLGLARNTVRMALRCETPPKYVRARRGSIVDAVEPEIRRLLRDVPDMPATVIAERIGWERGMTVLRDRIGELRPLFVPPDPAQRTWYRPGELAQFDLWQPDVLIPVGFAQSVKLCGGRRVGVLEADQRPPGSLSGRPRRPGRNASCDRQVRGGSPQSGVGSGGLYRPDPAWQDGTHRRVPGVPWHSGDGNSVGGTG